MHRLITSLSALALTVAIWASVATGRNPAQRGDERVPTSDWSDPVNRYEFDPATGGPILRASAVATTVVLASSKFDAGASCTANGWTTVDITETDDYWHVDDFTGAPWGGTSTANGTTFSPVQGAKSMWMAALPPASNPVNTTLCGYLSLPGYGNNWDQSFCSRNCLPISGGPTPLLDVAFKLKYDTQASYDGTALEFTTDCSGNTGWILIDGGVAALTGAWSGADSNTVTNSYAIGTTGPVKVRLHFTSDGSWSNQDGMISGFGVAVDSLSWETTPVEDFEDEAVGSTSSDDWESCGALGYGNYLALFKKVTGANYEDPCLDNYGCYWAALQGSTDFYSCGNPPQPAQRVIPYRNVRGQYISNEIWSPVIPFSGSGSEFRLRYKVYRDLPLDNLIFHVWHVRSIPASGCPGRWLDRGEFYYGDQKDWYQADVAIGSKLDLNTGTSMQVALGVIDMCPLWCGVYGTGACHSPAPYFDSVRVLRVNVTGPQWDVRPVDTFQDTFATNGTITGTARADAARDIKPSSSPTFTPGDSALVLYLVDPKYAGSGTNTSGLLDDPNLSTFVGRNKTKKQVYGYFTVTPFSAAKISPAISDGPGGSANRYPYMGTIAADGRTWAKVRMDYTYIGTAYYAGIGTAVQTRVNNRFNIDLNDELFTPGDTISYFFGATSLDGSTYYSSEYGSTSDISAVAANPMEFTILPAGGYNRGGDILYVDGADGTWNDMYFKGAFMNLGLVSKIDRYDVRDPSTASSNRLAGRVTNVAAQLNACYHSILWDCGSLAVTLGDGSGGPLKTDDYALLNTFLANLTQNGGAYLSGDDVAEMLNEHAGASAVTFRSTYMPFTLITGDHRAAPSSFRISPSIKAWPGRTFTDDFFIFGGCPEINDFDVMGASITSRVEMSYNTAQTSNGAVLSNQVLNANGKSATVVMSGFSLAQLRDDELNGLFDRAQYIRGILYRFGYNLPQVVGVPSAIGDNHLAQNYPNPFNPQTSIAFSLKERSTVSLKVYDVAGALVRELVSGTRVAGAYDAEWDGRDASGQQVASGVYFYRLVAGEFRSTKKMVLLK